MSTKTPKPPQSIGRQLNFTSGRVNALCQQLLEPYGLSLPQWALLSCLWREGELTVGTLSELIGTGLPATSRLIDRMVDNGLLCRRQDSVDGRITKVGVTDKAQDLQHLADFHKTINKTLFKGFSADERKQAFDLLQRMERNARDALE